MKTFEARLARKAIGSTNYKVKRMDQINREISYWISNEKNSTTARQRDFCREMQQMYLKRYQYYLNGFRKNYGQDSPRGGAAPFGDGSDAKSYAISTMENWGRNDHPETKDYRTLLRGYASAIGKALHRVVRSIGLLRSPLVVKPQQTTRGLFPTQ